MLTITRRLSSFLDAARWVAAAAVIQEHARILVLGPYAGQAGVGRWAYGLFYFLTGFGRLAVIVFFVLSGFLVGGEVLRQLSADAFSWRAYAVKRVARIYPVYVLALAAGCAFDWVGIHHANTQGVYTAGMPFPGLGFSVADRLTLPVLLKNLGFMQGLTSTTVGSNQPLWSIAFEAWYYLLFPLLLWPILKRRAPWGLRLLALGAGAAVICLIRGEMLWYFLIWLAGLLPHFAPGRMRPHWAAGFASFAAVLTVARLGLIRHQLEFETDVALALAFALCILGMARTGDAPLPGARIHKYLASFSYSLYASHWPILLLVVASAERLWAWGLRMQPSPAAILLWVSLVLLGYAWARCVAQITEFRLQAIRDRLFQLAGGGGAEAAPGR
jgi:peptidoglycan/LPS O-acetylase OafA/YrhL